MSLSKVRVLFAVVTALFLILGHFAYLLSNFQGKQSDFAAQMDRPPIQILSLLLLIGIIILSALKTKEEDVAR